MKANSIFSKLKQNLFFLVGLIVVIGVVGYSLFGKNSDQSGQNNNGQNNDAEDQQVKENVAVPEEDSAAVKPVREISADDHLWGDPNAPVKIIVYSDFECPFCARFSDTIEQIKQEFAGKIVIAFRQFPLLGTHIYALKAAEASECAAEQGKFWEMHNQLFADNQAEKLNDVQFKLDAKNLGLDSKKFDACLDSDKYQAKVEAQMTEAKDFNVNGTPTTFINGQIVVGAMPFEDFTAPDGTTNEGLKTLIQKALDKK